MAQTTGQKPDSLRFGSGQVLIGADAGSLVDIGCLRGLSFVSKAENSEVEFDNCPSILKFAKGDRGSFTLDLAEVDFTTLSQTDDGLVNLVFNAGTPVSITDETKTITSETPLQFDNKNGDNTRVASIVVTDVGGATTYVEGTDYEVFVGANGYTGILMIDGGAITSGQDVEIDYDYTPNANKTLTFNTTGSKVGKYVRIINTDSQGRTFQIDIQDASNINALEMPFVSDNEDDVMVVSLELEGTIVNMIDEQSIT